MDRPKNFAGTREHLVTIISFTTMWTSERIIVGALLLFSYLQLASTFSHDCTEEESKYWIEEKMSRDISFVRHDSSVGCAVKFRDDSR